MNRRAFLFAGAAMFAAPARAFATGAGAISATDLGILADSSDDQSAALQRAIDHAASERVPLYLPPGRYAAANLRLPSHARLTGVPGASTIAYSGAPGQLLRCDGGAFIALDGLTLDGGGLPVTGSNTGLGYLAHVERLAIDDCTITASGASGLSLLGCAGHIERCTISGAAEAGIFSLDGAGMSLAQNTITDCANGGILVFRSEDGEDGTLIMRNRIERIGAAGGGSGQNGNGINVYRGNGVLIADNRMADCAFTAVRVNSGSNVQVSANSCLRSGETAIFVEFGFQGAVVSGNLVDGAATGISISNFDQDGRLATCHGNVVRNLKTTIPYDDPSQGAGIGIAVEADTAVTGNVIENAPTFGINLGWGPFLRNVSATGNVIRQAGTGIGVSVAEGAGSAVIANNVISQAERGAIIGYRWRDAATGDLAVTPEDWPHLTVTGNRVD
ncbi:TIGR03808 family TAT-translocated repetitive protein [Breoghania sp. L-A4]|uniref:TIGR03808 family TAT-translocated repetitive protein n=1 Tax=Breoghania sp. L-A4 TaxID=2304600 RepID=UPI000E35E099|nr:TIGR03808 family TAT-translocated repetitive protein [Breoghania sp. L-A4]AXS39883.1 TIGR03808 family TAT-translocated repetitive protein [Breoghania sp. L-A4]